MKYLKPLLFCAPVLIVSGALAQDAAPATANDSLISPEVRDYIGFGTIMGMLVLFIVVMLILNRTFKVIAKAMLTPEQYAAMEAELKAAKVKKPKAEVINKLLSLKPLSEEKSLIIEHDYDGIQELDNPTPAWFMGLFYASITFAVVYMLSYHVFGTGQLQDDEYKTEMIAAAKEKEAYLAKSANRVDENTVKLSTEAAVLSSGAAVFKQSCSPCHGDKGQGIVGPNLTDDFWLHGGKVKDIFKTIKYGFTAKGMPNWEKQLSPKQISDVANYIKSLHGSNPPGAKEAQGNKEVDDEPAADAPATTAAVIKS